jgi:hypothetical protein
MQRFLRRPGRRYAVPSIVNAVELLRTKDVVLRETLCRTLAGTFVPGVVLLPHPVDVLERSAEAFRQGRASVLLEEDDETRTLRRLLEDPSLLDAARLTELDDWAAREKESLENFWRYVTDHGIRVPGLKVDEGFLDPGPVSYLSDYSVSKKLELTETELRDLVAQVPPWSAFALMLGLSLEMINRAPFSKTKANTFPNGPDFLQLTYLGLVGHFVCDDRELLSTARRAAEILHSSRGYRVSARSATDFFLAAGYEHPERPKTFSTAAGGARANDA